MFGVLVLLAAVHGLSAQLPQSRAVVPTLKACTVPGIERQVLCGTHEVWENRDARKGRRLSLRVVVVPASTGQSSLEPLFYLAGGPGEAATERAAGLVQDLAAIVRKRDLVLVDLRGTGGSHPLDCRLFDPKRIDSYMGDVFPQQAVRACRAELEKDADLTQYTTTVAMDDLDEVRAALGYDRINLFGLSYGTRAALTYVRRHGEHVRSVVLQGVVPPGDYYPVRLGADSQRALDGVLKECMADATCRATFPGIERETRTLFASLGKKAASVPVLDPATATAQTVTLSKDVAVHAVRYLLGESGSANRLPALLHLAARGDLGPLAEFALFIRQRAVDAPGTGLYLSVTCAEDEPFVNFAVAERVAKGTLAGIYPVLQQRQACALWPRASIPSDFDEPLRSSVPTLILSGEWDPVTPPERGERVAAGLSASRHVVVPHGGHMYYGLTNRGCIDNLVATFVDRGDATQLDTSCVQRMEREGFATTLPPVTPIALPETELKALAGHYRRDGTAPEITVEIKGGTLSLSGSGFPSVLLVPVAPDRLRVVGTISTYFLVTRQDTHVTTLRLEENGGVVMEFRRKEP